MVRIMQTVCWEGNIWSGPCHNTFPKKKNNMLSSPVHPLSGMEGRCECGFLDQLLDCFLIKDTSDVTEHVSFYL